MGTFVVLLSIVFLFGYAVSDRDVHFDCPTTPSITLNLYEVTNLILSAIGANNNCVFNVLPKPYTIRLLSNGLTGMDSVAFGVGASANAFDASSVVDSKLLYADTDIIFNTNGNSTITLILFYGGDENYDTNIDESELNDCVDVTTENFPVEYPSDPYGGSAPSTFEVNAGASASAITIEFHMIAIGGVGLTGTIQLFDASNTNFETINPPNYQSLSRTVYSNFVKIVINDNISGNGERVRGVVFTVCKGVALGDNCTLGADECSADNAICSFATPGDCAANITTCICPQKYTVVGDECQDLQTAAPELGETCDDSQPCSDENAECSNIPCNRICECKTGYKQEGNRCAIKLQGNCSVDSECVSNAVCRGTGVGKCECDEDFFQLSHECIAKNCGKGHGGKRRGYRRRKKRSGKRSSSSSNRSSSSSNRSSNRRSNGKKVKARRGRGNNVRRNRGRRF